MKKNCLFILLVLACACDRGIVVQSPEGTAPVLPAEVRLKDGLARVRWEPADRAGEEALADASLHPAGSSYQLSGQILGGDSAATVTATVQVVPAGGDAPEAVAAPLPVGDVRIIGENRLSSNRDLDVRTLLSWDVTKYLYNYRDTYGLDTEGYATAEGWDSPRTKLKGHGTGHYMSALAYAYAGTDDPQVRSALMERIRRIVDELRACQELTFVWDESLGRYREARDFAPEQELLEMKGTWADFDTYKGDCRSWGYGYLNAIPAQHPVLVEAYRPYHNENWVWAPYYTIHKQLAGLIDIAQLTDDRTVADKALLIAKDMGLWVWNRLHYRTFVASEGTAEERRARPGNRYEMWNMYIAGEVGGMQESLARLAALSADPTERDRLLEAARCFDAPAFYGPLARGIDDIRGRHANQHIPMVIGALQSYRETGDPAYYAIASNFWELVQGRYVYATGGVGNGEMFREPYTQMLSLNTNVRRGRQGSVPDPNINETCCAYNLAKLTRDLNCFDPDNARYMDYYERVLYNQIVGSLHPEHYGVTYQYALGLNARKPFGNRTAQESCCGGTGAENHVRYQEAAYFVSDRTLWVALYLPTEARWREKGVAFRQECAWPAEQSTITITEGGRFAMKLRVPYWADGRFAVRLNGKKVRGAAVPTSYIEIPERDWKPGDTVEIRMPYTRHVWFEPDRMTTAAVGPDEVRTDFPALWEGALMLGPLVMATDGITSWDEATVQLSPDLHEVGSASPSDETGLHSLSFDGKLFYPDYSFTGPSTHYLRIER